MILVTANIVIQDGRMPEAVRISQEQAVRTRKEPGCISYAVNQDIENPQQLMFFEQWTDAGAVQRHFTAAHAIAFAQQLGALAAATPIMALYKADPITA
jgi:quinol monooxygenase YgiN